MDHRSYESWLLDDERLTAGQERELRLHLQSCPQCAALAYSNRTLRAAPMSAPPAGFALRFQGRLAAERKAQRIRNISGLTLILIVGMSIVLLLMPVYLTYVSSSPVQLAVKSITDLMAVGFALRSIGQTCNTLVCAATAFVPSYVWALAFILVAGIGFFWFFSSRKFTRFLEMRGRGETVTPGGQA